MMRFETTNRIEVDRSLIDSPSWSGYEAANSASKVSVELAPDAGDKATAVAPSGLDGNYDPEHQHLQHVASTAPPASAEYIIPQTQPELVEHSIVCAPYPYSDPYYGGLLAAYGVQALVHPHSLGVHQNRMPLPLEMAEEPVYVNPKQYNGIMRRRQSRAKAELEKKLIKVRKPYLHESRHQHAIKRQRGCGGRFLKTKELSHEAKATAAEGMGSAASPNTQPGSGLMTESTGRLIRSNHEEEVDVELKKRDTNEQCTYADDGSKCFHHHQDFQLSTIHTVSGERGEEGDCSGQLRGSILVSQASHRALTIQ